MDLKKLSTGELVTGVSGLVLFIIGFFHWYGVGGGSVNVSGVNVNVPGVGFNGWQAPSSILSVLAILIGLAMAGYVIATKLAGVDLPAKLGNLGMGFVLLIAGGAAFVFVLIKWISNTHATKFGLYVGLIAAAGLAVGGFLIAKERGDLPASLGGSGGSAPRPPAA